jgi:glycosyltransferase involved in cell wall biosynthesis
MSRGRMRILFLTQIVPYPPDSGPKIKTYNVLRYLAQRHDVHLLSFARSASETQHAQALHAMCASVTTVPLHRSRRGDFAYLARSVFTGRPFLVERDDVPGMRAAVARLLARCAFDAVHADQLTMGQFAVDLPVRLRVLDEHNAVWTIVQRSAKAERGARRVAAELEWRKLRAYEGELCKRFDRVTVVSDDDRQALLGTAGATISCLEIPIAVDTDELPFIPRGAEARHVLSVATMFYPPNVEGVDWFARQVFPIVQRIVPDASFRIVGSRPPARIQRLADEQPGIVVTGYVADLAPVLRESAVLVVPVHSGSGMRVKILEAFARGIPVVSTTLGVEGIAAHSDEHLLVADTPASFAAAVTRILREPETSARLARAGRELVCRRYDWRSALAGLDQLYAHAPAGRA